MNLNPFKKTDINKEVEEKLYNIFDKYRTKENMTIQEEAIFSRINQITNNYITENLSYTERKTLLALLENDYVYREKQTITTWREAIYEAENYLSRFGLHKLFEEIKLDSYVSSTIDLRKSKVTGTPFITYVGEEQNDDMQNLFDQKWFYEFISNSMDYIFEGFSLQELVIDVNGTIKTQKIPLKFVVPELSIFKKNPNTYNITEGIKYNEDKKYSKYMIESFENRRDLGLYTKLAPLWLWMKASKVAFSQYNEQFGIPMIIYKTPNKKENERRKIFNDLLKFGRSKVAVTDTVDQYEIKEATNTDAYNIFKEFDNICKNEIAQLILGGSMITSDGSSYSQSQVHQLQFDAKTRDDIKKIEYVVNDVLIPKLVTLGLVTPGTWLKFDLSENLTMKEKFEIDSQLMQKYILDIDYINETYNTNVTNRILGGMEIILDENNNMNNDKNGSNQNQ